MQDRYPCISQQAGCCRRRGVPVERHQEAADRAADAVGQAGQFGIVGRLVQVVFQQQREDPRQDCCLWRRVCLRT